VIVSTQCPIPRKQPKHTPSLKDIEILHGADKAMTNMYVNPDAFIVERTWKDHYGDKLDEQ
jgi:hypothetical protein